MNILLTSVGRRSYLVKYFKECVGENGEIHVANSSDVTPAFLVADKAIVTPLIYDSEYIPFLLEYCQDNRIDAIISLFDIDLPVLAKHRDDFQAVGTNVIVADYDKVVICNDKWETFCFLKEKKICVPETFLSADDAIKAEKEGSVHYPFIIKPRWGMGSIAIFEAENEQELRVFYAKVKSNIQKTYLKYESAMDLDNCVIIQEKLEGQEFGLDVINDLDSNFVTTIVKQKYAMRSGETDCAVTVNNSELKMLGEKLSNIMKHRANMDVDIFYYNEKYYVLEMNARFGGGYPFSHMAGVNLPLAIVKWIKGEKVDRKILTEKIGVMAQKDIEMVCLSTK